MGFYCSIFWGQECSRCAEFNLTGERARLRRVGLELDLTLFYSNLWFSWLLGENGHRNSNISGRLMRGVYTVYILLIFADTCT